MCQLINIQAISMDSKGASNPVFFDAFLNSRDDGVGLSGEFDRVLVVYSVSFGSNFIRLAKLSLDVGQIFLDCLESHCRKIEVRKIVFVKLWPAFGKHFDESELSKRILRRPSNRLPHFG